MGSTLFRRLLLLSGLIFPACASAYRPSAASVQLRSTLDDRRAESIVASALKRDSDGRGGIKRAQWGLTSASPFPIEVKVTRGVIEYLVPGSPETSDAALDEGCTSVRNHLEAIEGQEAPTLCRKRLHLDDLWRVRISGASAGMRTVAGYMVSIQESASAYIDVNITTDQLNPLIAALTYYSPNVELLEGAGF